MIDPTAWIIKYFTATSIWWVFLSRRRSGTKDIKLTSKPVHIKIQLVEERDNSVPYIREKIKIPGEERPVYIIWGRDSYLHIKSVVLFIASQWAQRGLGSDYRL